MTAADQRRLIVDQFTRQAVPFSEMPNHNNEDTNRLVIETAGIDADDTVLDVACGPGLITSAIAGVALHVTGIDITPAMIEQAEHRQASLGLKNMTWRVGDIDPLPFDDDTFSAVVTRYSFHHFLTPKKVLGEMVRACRPGGKVAVIDVFMNTPEQADLYNRMEKLRDPSHTRALLLEELTGYFIDAGLTDLKTAFYKVDVDLEALLAATRTEPAGADAVRQIFCDDLDKNLMGVGAVEKNGAIHFGFPIVVLVGRKT
ncbi:class I SAM-dependent methyltransferase [Fimbriiglobus ruber]|uniref:SAM-dependent methyltransferase n=1 Tax=Fimbriiglobus ruber TaxID=1908690 RepID=A0A225DSM9_9BACT|nr:methyltransferase domain-containing protein [Fimbriiglobus ruber]OWK40576.1 SAM-dependent methyltransferase [Fimbriiglobus ruber]